MTTELSLDEKVLLGTRAALAIKAPQMSQTIDMVLNQGHLPISFKPGASAIPSYTGNIGREAAESILTTLKSMEQEFGYNHLFGERQINWLDHEWNRVCKALSE